MTASDTSLILSTYNQPAWLEKSLWGYAAQDAPGFELVVADDGSGPETRGVIERARRETGLRIRHVWHEDQGFRKTLILNKAILASRGEYLIFSDGDCIPRADFVRTHLELREPGRFLSGGMVKVDRDISELIARDDVASGRFIDYGWLRARGAKLGRHRLRVLPQGRAAAALDVLTTTKPNWNGGNSSTFRELVLAVNGFDSDMVYGGEDGAFGERLTNFGVHGKQVRFRAAGIHLDHDRPYMSREGIRRNQATRRRIRREREWRARIGIEELEEPVEVVGEVAGEGGGGAP